MNRFRALLFQSPGFEQDVRALNSELPDEVDLMVCSTELLGEHFLAIFDPSVLDINLSLYTRPEHEAKRQRWARSARALVRDLFAVFPFDVAVAPADDTPYWGAVGQAIEELGVPFIVLMKEVTHPVAQLTTLAPMIRRYFPRRAPHTLVNSRRSAEYAVAAGALPASVTIVGQPRFDLYTRPNQMPRLQTLAPECDPARPTVLFLSYEADAYLTLQTRLRIAAARHAYLSTSDVSTLVKHPFAQESWLRQRCETELTILKVAASQNWNVLVKPHRQTHQREREIDRSFVAMTAARYGARYAYLDSAADVRPLIYHSQMIVGFQTTALFEAMAIGKKTIYAHWADAPVHTVEDGEMIPFWEWTGALIVRSGDELETALSDQVGASPPEVVAEIVRDWLGPVDGAASQRVWEHIVRLGDAQRTSRSCEARALRERLLARRSQYLTREARRASTRRTRYKAMSHLLRQSMPRASLRPSLLERLEQLQHRAALREMECAWGLENGRTGVLTGPFAVPLHRELARFVLGILSAVTTSTRPRQR